MPDRTFGFESTASEVVAGLDRWPRVFPIVTP